MAKKRGRLQLVSPHDPANVFDDLDALRQAQAAPAAPAFQGQRRQRSTETFARIPHDRARRLYHLRGRTVWVLLIELDRLILEGRGRNPVKLTSQCLKAIRLSHDAKTRALRQLAAEGIISIEQRPGQAPLVIHHWFPRTDLRGNT